MLKELNVGVRIITGVANKKSPHAWNIVSINGLWYNLDTTWDENITETSSNTAYNYFLKSENDFGGHERDFEFKTDDFNFQYTMAQESFENKKYEDEDVNRDGIIDSLDLAEVASRYNYSSLDIGWDNKYDLNKDCIIDIYDIVKVSARL